MTKTTTTTTTRPATIRARAYVVDGVYHYDIVADIHDTGEVIIVERARYMGFAMSAAGIATDGDFHNDPLAAGWVMAEGSVTR